MFVDFSERKTAHRKIWRIISFFEKIVEGKLVWKKLFFFLNEYIFSEMVLDTNLLWSLAQQYTYLILATTEKEFTKCWPQVFSFPDQAQEPLEYDLKRSPGHCSCMMATFSVAQRKRGHTLQESWPCKRHGAFNSMLSLDVHWLCGEPSLPWFLPNSLFSQLAYSRKKTTVNGSQVARQDSHRRGDWAGSGPKNLEAASRTWREDKGMIKEDKADKEDKEVQGSCQSLHSSTSLNKTERRSSNIFLFVKTLSGEKARVAIITQT